MTRSRGASPTCRRLINRAAEVWWALLAIADTPAATGRRARTRGGDEARAGGDEADDVPDRCGCSPTFATRSATSRRSSPRNSSPKLNALDESPWGARRKGEGLDARGLSSMLRPFKIRPRTVRVGEMPTSKGYHRDQFDEVWELIRPREDRGGRPVMTEPWLDKRGLAEHLSCSVRSIQTALAEGLPHAVIFGRVKFQVSDGRTMARAARLPHPPRRYA